MKNFLFLGKGGSGKTTLSILFSTKLKETGSVYLASLDPSHNLSDYMRMKIRDRGRKVHGVYAREIDLEKALSKFLDEISKEMRALYPGLELFSTGEELEVLKNSPGSLEGAILEVLKEILKTDFDYLVLDMPPTGLALRFLTLVISNRVWAQKLIKVRRKIVEEKESIENIEGRESKRDLIEEELKKILNELEWLYETLKTSNFVVVLEPYEASVEEASRISNFLKKFFKTSPAIVLNKVKSEKETAYLERFKDEKKLAIPFLENILENRNAKRYIEEII